MKFQTSDENSKFSLYSTFSPTRDENLILSTREFLVYFLKKMATSQGRFKWTDDKPVNLIKFLQELDSSYVKIHS